MATSKKPVYSFFYIAAIIFLLAYALTAFRHIHDWGGWLLALFFLSLAIAFRGNKVTKGYWYRVMILAVASVVSRK